MPVQAVAGSYTLTVITVGSSRPQQAPASPSRQRRVATETRPTRNSIHSKEEKSIIVKITDKDEAKNIKSQSRKDIAQRIQKAAGGAQAAYTVLAVR
jgi:hypothetical protein